MRYILAGRQWVDVLDRPEDTWLPDLLRALAGLGLVGVAREQAAVETVEAPPAPETSAPRPGNLPAALTSFVGREHEVAEAVRLLDETRLLTLTGPGGTGKTRLSLAVAAAVQPRFPDGVWFVDLAPLTDPALVPAAIARTLGVPEVDDIPLLETLQAYLRHRRLLLVLDNFEQLLPAASAVTTLLAASAGLQVLVTSRVLLHAAGEQEYPVPPLPLPASAEYEEIAHSPAVQLFTQRARAAQVSFNLSPANAVDVAAICRRLDGLPLALELAAARVKLLAPAALLTRLERRLPLLTGGARTLPQRQQTLQATIAWSWGLLSEPERVLFRRLGVFAGGWTLEAAEAVCDPDGELDVCDGLTSLVDQSLVQQQTGADGEPRFSMLVTLREYALERLAEAGETDSLRRRHLEHFLAMATAADAQVWAGSEAGAMARLDAEQGNLREALSWAVDASEAELGLRLVGGLEFWFNVRSPAEGRRVAETLLAAPGGSPHARALAHHTAARCAYALLDGDAARTHLSQATANWRETGDINWLGRMAVASAWCNRPDQAQVSLGWSRAALELQSVRDEPHTSVLAHLGVAIYSTLLGDAQGGHFALEQARALIGRVNSPWLTHYGLLVSGIIALSLGDAVAASHHFNDALLLGRGAGDVGSRPSLLCLLAAAELADGQPTDARTNLLEALQLAQQLSSATGQMTCVLGLAALMVHGSAVTPAARLLGAAKPVLDQATGHNIPAVIFLRQLVEPAVRAQLGEEAFAAAVAEGQALSLEQAIALALAETASR